MKRIKSLDFARIFFAFLVVSIHTPVLGKDLLTPISLTAVPFFYLLTGFFLYSNDADRLLYNIRKNIKNYFVTWIKYFVALFCALQVLRHIYDNKISITMEDVVKQLFVYGNSPFFDVIKISGVSYGVSALWFLYAGFISLIFFFFLRKNLLRKWLFVAVVIWWILSTTFNYSGGWPLTRVFSIPFPYFYFGYCLSFVMQKRKNVERNGFVISFLGCALFLPLLYIECYFFHGESYSLYTLLPSSVALFYLLVKVNHFLLRLNVVIDPKITLDIYIWHRLVYVLLVGCLGVNLHRFDAIIVYSLCFVTSLFVRTVGRYSKKRENNL